MLSLILRWTSIPSRGLDILLVAYYYGNQDNQPLAAWTT